MSKKYIIIASILSIIVLCSYILENKIFIYDKFTFYTKELPKTIDYKIPSFNDRLHIELTSSGSLCREYINKKYINIEILKNKKTIDMLKVDEIKSGQVINIKIFSNKVLNNCKMTLEIADPYGNLLKAVLLIQLPILIVFYLLFKTIWLFVARKISSITKK